MVFPRKRSLLRSSCRMEYIGMRGGTFPRATRSCCILRTSFWWRQNCARCALSAKAYNPGKNSIHSHGIQLLRSYTADIPMPFRLELSDSNIFYSVSIYPITVWNFSASEIREIFETFLLCTVSIENLNKMKHHYSISNSKFLLYTGLYPPFIICLLYNWNNKVCFITATVS